MATSRRNMRNHMQPFDVIHLPGDVACPKEIVEANLPNGDVKQVLLLYDTGATMTTGTQDVTLLDQRYRPAITGPITTTGVNSKLVVSYDHVEVWLGGEDGNPPIRVPVNCRGQSKTAPPPGVDYTLWENEPGPLALTGSVEKTPLIVIGADAPHLHPLDIPDEEVPRRVKRRYPNCAWKRSRITGRVLNQGPTGTRYPTRTRSFCRYPNPTRFFFKIIGYFGYRVFQKILTFASI